ncbi:TetR/AcrR family transcriptional regulator [Saccharothrix coeruleofusca]|uniref:TetR family transcriptional regulator n=1 Tax=Saccharothrix coeruleofusca TaxID=33919 RepID=A0A918EF12_9PSEU|nr:TetR/AcrR family transcriptional regulator [Saccharothrix coeruleofusca]MBP2339189.1 AcrR family transcriptional regulator [Saccharothrix coeruleofusca]GGP70560.1 TetR family transcriptional regulator [Saccharothrix coeruleofusca]
MPRPKTHDDALRVRLLDRAGELLSTEGPSALSLRRLAADVNTSTTAVYSLFGGKPALLDALYQEAFRRFAERLEAVAHTDDPVEDLVRIGLAYRCGALADPQFYLVMFSKVVPDFKPSEQTDALAACAFRPAVAAARRAVESGAYAEDVAPEQIALAMWGLVHGLVSLELNGNLPAGLEIAPVFERALRAQADGWRA